MSNTNVSIETQLEQAMEQLLAGKPQTIAFPIKKVLEALDLDDKRGAIAREYECQSRKRLGRGRNNIAVAGRTQIPVIVHAALQIHNGFALKASVHEALVYRRAKTERDTALKQVAETVQTAAFAGDEVHGLLERTARSLEQISAQLAAIHDQMVTNSVQPAERSEA